MFSASFCDLDTEDSGFGFIFGFVAARFDLNAI